MLRPTCMVMARAHASSAAARVRSCLRSRKPGVVFVPDDLADLGPRGAIDSALLRLLRSNEVRRLARGVYDVPKVHPIYGPLTPPLDTVARAIARSTGESLATGPATAANFLGLSTQVPAKALYLTDGTSRDIAVGKQVIRFRRSTPSKMAGGDTTAGLLLRALRYLGRDGIDDAVRSRARALLTNATRAEFAALRRHAPAWLRPIVDDLLDGGARDPA
jgi:hypothetical protein